jgi:hypothetical protein
MGLKNEWVDKVDGVDDVVAKDINGIAHAVIALEDDRENTIGNIETVLDAIIAIQNELIGGDA